MCGSIPLPIMAALIMICFGLGVLFRKEAFSILGWISTGKNWLLIGAILICFFAIYELVKSLEDINLIH
jgi:hypothetical protein